MNSILPARNDMAWLVKSGDRIVGPYSADTIENLLRAREIVVIDEIKRPGGRWKYIREEVFFAAAVERMRTSTQSKIEDTHATLSSPTATGSGTNTATLTATTDMSRTLDLEIPETDSSQSAYIKDAEFIDIEVDQNEIAPSVNQAQNQKQNLVASKQFGFTTSAQMQNDIKKSSSTVWAFALIFVGVALTIAYKIQVKPSSTTQAPDFAKTYDLAIKSYRHGYFADSLKYYKEALALRPNDPDVVIGMSPLLLSIEGQKVEVKRKIGEVLAVVHSEDQVKQAKNILGLIAIADEDYVEAIGQFNDAIKIDSKYLPAIFNGGIVQFLKKDYGSAVLEFSKVLVEDPENAAASYLIIRSKLAQALIIKKTSFTDLHESIKNFSRKFYDLRQEVNLIGSYLYSLEDEKEHAADQIRNTLEVDPFVSEEFLRDPRFSTSQLGWIHLANSCEEMDRKFSNSPDMKALYAICLIKTGRAQEGPKLIEEALAQTPNDSLLLSIKAYVLMSSGRSEEAHAALDLAKKMQSPEDLSKILMGRICMKTKDDNCIQQNFQNLTGEDSAPGIAIVALTESARRAGNKNSTKIYREQLKRNLQNYLPAIRLENELGSN